MVWLTRDEIEDTVRKLMDDKSATPDELVGRLVGFASAHFAYRGTLLPGWLAYCEQAYVHSREEGTRRGLISAPD